MSKNTIPNIKDVSRVPDELLPVIQWSNRYGRVTTWIVMAVIVTGALAFYWSHKSNRAQDDASLGFAVASTAEDFKALREGGNAVAAIAEARAYNVNGEYEAALACLADVNVDEASMKDRIAMNKAIALEGLKRYDEALQTVGAVSENADIANEALYLKARLLAQKGDKAAAAELAKSLPEGVQNVVEGYGVALTESAPVVEATPAPAPEATPAPEAAPAPEAPAAQ
jgi:tetratricopeptide (TPR) repeat protein